MKYSVPFHIKSETAKSPAEGDQKVFSAIASTDALDRDREVLIPKGVITDQFMKNPVMLRIHDYRHVPVGKVLGIEVDEKQVKFDFVFTDDEEGKSLQNLYEKGFMSAFSVGFYPKAMVDVDENTPPQINLEVANGESVTFDLTKYKLPPRRVISQWELLEISPVPVPSNPEALLLRMKDEVVRKFMGTGQHSKAEQQLLEERLGDELEDLMQRLKTFSDECEEVELHSAIPSHSTPIKQGSWDGGAARTSLARWASSDGSGDKEQMNWGKYGRGFAWVDSEKADNFTSYKLPHHTISDGELVAVWRGITAAMAALMGARGGVDLGGEDGRAVYNHLARHYRDADKEPPEYGKEYTEEELKAIEEDAWPLAAKDPTVDDPSNTGEPASSGDPTATEPKEGFDFDTAFKQLKNEVVAELHEVGETLRVKNNIMLDAIMLLQESIAQLKMIKTDEADDVSDPPVVDTLNEDEKSLAQLHDTLSNLSKLLIELH